MSSRQGRVEQSLIRPRATKVVSPLAGRFASASRPTTAHRRSGVPVLGFILLLFASANFSANAQTAPPVLLSEPTSTRAVALDSVLFLPEPFPLNMRFPWDSYGRMRITLFALNLQLQPGEDASVLTAEAEDAAHVRHSLVVEYVGPVPAQSWMSEVVVRLGNDMAEMGDVLVRVSYRGTNSNRVRVGIGHVGGGPPDDVGSAPTPAPPYKISGRVMADGSGLGGVSLALAGPQNATGQTDADGNYSLDVPTFGNYTVTASHAHYDFSPAPRTFTNLSGNQSGVNFSGSRRKFIVSGRILDDRGQGLDGIEVGITEKGGTAPFRRASTSGGGFFSLPDIAALYDYTVTALTTNTFTFPAQQLSALGGNLQLDIRGARRSYRISGWVTDELGTIIVGSSHVTIKLGGSQTATTTTGDDGTYSFTVAAGGDYTLSPQTNALYSFDMQPSFTNLVGDQTANLHGRLRRYTIGGRVTEGATGLGGVTVILGGSRAGSATTDANGDYSFTELPAGGVYTVSLSRGNYTFDPSVREFNPLLADQTVNSTATLNRYKLSGRITDAQGSGMAGVSVTAVGSQTFSGQTDDDGKYSLTLPGDSDYTLSVSKPYHVFTPSSRTFNNLSADTLADFTGERVNFQVSGRVLDAQGAGLPGVNVTLSGALATNSVTTGQDGRYSLTAPGGGSYTLTPFVEGDYYAITPTGHNFANLGGNEVVPDFTATLTPLPDPQYVLEFDGTPKTAMYGYFWQPRVNLGHFYWEFWAMPGANAAATYMLADGYGGAHALLFGVASINTTEPGRYQLMGNIWDGTQITYFTSDEGPAIGEWGHFAVGWDGKNITTYLNGVPVGRSPFTGPRLTPGTSGGGSWLMIGGSDHSNFDGRIAQVRGFEGSNPREGTPGSNSVETAFAPQTVFNLDGQFLTYYFRQTMRPPDLSRGYEGNVHPGLLRTTRYGVLAGCTGDCPTPQYVIDPTAPNFVTAAPSTPVHVDSPTPAPSGALVYDSFSRVNSTYILGGMGGLGSTESGTAGRQTWLMSQGQTGPQPFGILNGRAVPLGNGTFSAWVETGSTTANLDVRVNRHPGRMSAGIHTGLSFRVVDAANYFFAYTRDGSAPGTQVLDLGYYLNGQRVDLALGVGLPQGWTTLRVVTKAAGSIAVYLDGASIYSTNSSVMATATGAGLYNNAPGSGLVNRWDDFTVFAVP